MVQQLPALIYPDSDGQPMADNTKQFRWIVVIKENLELLFAAIADVFVAGDLLWYPIQGDNKTRQAPDAMVVFGRPKGDRGSYFQAGVKLESTSMFFNNYCKICILTVAPGFQLCSVAIYSAGLSP